MKVTLQLDDELAERYQARGRDGQPLEQILQIQLKRFVAYDPKERFVIIGLEDRVQLEELTGRMPLSSAADLVRRVAALAELSIGSIRFRWTAAQYRDLKDKAARWRMSPEAYAERIVREIEAQFFSFNPRETKESIRQEAPDDRQPRS